VSAIFRVKFGHYRNDGDPQPLTIRDLFPKDEKGDATEVHWGRGSQGNVQLSVGHSGASLGGGGAMSKNLEYTRKTTPRVRGHGVHSSTAEWTFQEDEGHAGRDGLNSQYDLCVTLPETANNIWMEFWCKAVLVKEEGWGKRVILEMGTPEQPYKRNVDLNNNSSTSA
jgi:hypothetical protein